MEINVSVKTTQTLFSEFKEREPAYVDIQIVKLPISKRHLVGKEIEKIVWEQFKSAIKLQLGKDVAESDLLQ